MVDLELGALVDFGRNLLVTYPDAVAGLRLKSNETQQPATAFLDNVARVKVLIELPFFLVNWAGSCQAVADRALFNLTGDLTLIGNDGLDQKKYEDEIERLWKIRNTDGGFVITSDGKAAYPSPADAAAKNLTGILDSPPGEKLATALHALYAAVLIGAYTAFECLCGDLWKDAVNARPRSLAKNALIRGAKSKHNDDKQQEASLPISIIANNDFNVSAKMGTILAERDKAKFESFFDIEDSYLGAFRLSEDPKLRPSNILSAMFSAANKDVRSLEQIRNLLVHNGGVVDRQFLDNIGKTSIPPAGVEMTKPLHISGSMIAKYAGATLAFAKSLLAFVDDWLVKYPQ